MAEIEIEIDGKKLMAQPSQTVIQVADAAGIYIPRFCYHQKLSIPANCRMCLVEIEKAPKTLPACSTPVAPGMKVFTKSAKTIAAQRSVMEFLLINHPLDCPICDQGGECELQDLSMGYGSAWSHYTEAKRAIADQDLGPLIETEMTRCIYCTRCVRFGDEIAGLSELGLIGRGEFTEISTYIKHAIHAELSGNIIDLCPVGALTSKPFRYQARAWELEQAPSISPHDCLGTNINVHTRYSTVMRVVSRDNVAINDTWIADRDRFSYTGLYHADRLQTPQAKINGIWQEVDWEQALYLAAKAIRSAVSPTVSLGALASPSSTLEEFYLLQKIVRTLGSNNIDHRLREIATQEQAQYAHYPNLSLPFNAMEQCDVILLIGSNIQKEQPIAAMQLRKAQLKGAQIYVVNPCEFNFSFAVNHQQIIAPQYMAQTLQTVLAQLQQDEENVYSVLKNKKVCILLGALALHHQDADWLRYYTQQIAATLNDAHVGWLTSGANSAGGWLAGAIPQRTLQRSVEKPGLSAYAMCKEQLAGYILMNVEPDLDMANASLCTQALANAQTVVALSIYQNETLKQHADVILPMTPFSETAGTFVNTNGYWQHFNGCAKPYGEARPAWKILRALANFLELEGYNYQTIEEVRQEIKNQLEHVALAANTQLAKPTQPIASMQLARIGEIPLYAVDAIVRHAEPLQDTQTIVLGQTACVRLHPETAKQIGVAGKTEVSVRQDTETLNLPLVLDARIAKDAAHVYGGIKETSALGDLFGAIEVF